MRAGASRRPSGLLVPAADVSAAARRLTDAGIGPVTVSRPDFVYETDCKSFEALKSTISDVDVKTVLF